MDRTRGGDDDAESRVTPISPEAARSMKAAREEAEEAEMEEATRDLERALDVVKMAPEERELRIKALRAAIKSGKYELDAETVAQRLIDHGF